MRNALLLSLLTAALTGAAPDGVAAQGQPAPAPKPTTQPTTTQQPAPAPKPAPPTTTTPKPAQPAAPAPAPAAGATPAPRRAPAAAPTASRAGMAITVTDSGGGTMAGVSVSANGPTMRNGETNGSGQVSFPGMLAGVYRLRFDGESIVAFEKEVTVKPGQVLAVDVMLSAAKKVAPAPAPAPAAAPPPAAASAKTGPAGAPLQVSVPKVLEGDFVGKNPRRESLLSCSGSTRTTMLQINQPMPERMYADADVVYYVIGGEGTMKLDGKETKLALNDFVSVPRGGSHSFERRGNRTLILLSVLGGEPCDAPK
ncbi:MAG TPA: carboxypeptidase regulatory-like domain-containing protein [Vicinamibacterales bacterium]|jgi:mannose-6-phosphate isomerase-like protein (cupin superfamily)|nr:carboxypeptidase regulatory-like domain-containing protein [Vicinamibacterales bacterium]